MIEKSSRGFYGQRRQRIRFRSRRVERACSTHSRNAKFVFGFHVERFEIRVSDRPISEPCPSDRAPAAPLDEVDFVKTPLRTSIVHGAAAHAPSITNCWCQLSLLLGGLPKCIW